MKNGVDLTEFKKFVQDFKIAREEFEPFLKKFMIEMAERLIKKTKDRTPVDTGALRGKWEIGEIKGDGTNLYVEILNGMEYASQVEYGHTTRADGWVNGSFMLTISMDEIQQQMNPRFQKAFKSWAKEKGIGV